MSEERRDEPEPIPKLLAMPDMGRRDGAAVAEAAGPGLK